MKLFQKIHGLILQIITNFQISNNIEQIDQTVLQDVLEKTVNATKREIRGQFATPYQLADLLSQMTVKDWTKACADLCAGTGTIAKAIIDNKVKRTNNPEESFKYNMDI